jgi:hypothetical protein
MSMRTLIGAGVIVVLTGCGARRSAVGAGQQSQTLPQTAEEEEAANCVLQASLVRSSGDTSSICPDGTTNCCQTNGTGVYSAERGHVGIGANRLMITHFINNGSEVTFQGRYRNPRSNHWEMLRSPGLVYRADYHSGTYQKENLDVVSVRESSTVPTWTLVDPVTQAPPFIVTDSELRGLKLYIRFTASPDGREERYALDFDDEATILGKQPLRMYNMRWRGLTDNAQPTQYCSDASNVPDPVVFQQGIDVEPVTGSVKRGLTTAGFVTMSCSRGAPAKVYGWGYAYAGTPTETFYFDAGIHMKRASYCGDSQYYTVAGTKIQIADDQHIQNEYKDIKNVEARWTPTGAICLEPDHERHPEMVANKGFTGLCNNQQLPRCSHLPPPVSPYLADGPVLLPSP